MVICRMSVRPEFDNNIRQLSVLFFNCARFKTQTTRLNALKVI